MRRVLALVTGLVAIGCGRSTSHPSAIDAASERAREDTDATTAPDSAVAEASEGGPGDAGALDAARAASCGPTKLQPKACIPSHDDLVLSNDGIKAWLEARGAKAKDYTFEFCREVAFGTDAEALLVCIDMRPQAMDPSMGIAGPVEHRFDLDVVGVRNKTRVELLRLPFALGLNNTNFSTYSELFFSARYRVDAGAGVIEIEAPPEECAAAPEGLKSLFNEANAELRSNASVPRDFAAQLIRANGLERTSDVDHIKAICSARGRWARVPDGRFARSGK